MAVIRVGRKGIDIGKSIKELEAMKDSATDSLVAAIQLRLEQHIESLRRAGSNRASQLRAIGSRPVSQGTVDDPLKGTEIVALKTSKGRVVLRITQPDSHTGASILNILVEGRENFETEDYMVFPMYEGHVTHPDELDVQEYAKIVTRRRKKDGRLVPLFAKVKKVRGMQRSIMLELIVQDVIDNWDNYQMTNRSPDGKFAKKLKPSDFKMQVIYEDGAKRTIK